MLLTYGGSSYRSSLPARDACSGFMTALPSTRTCIATSSHPLSHTINQLTTACSKTAHLEIGPPWTGGNTIALTALCAKTPQIPLQFLLISKDNKKSFVGPEDYGFRFAEQWKVENLGCTRNTTVHYERSFSMSDQGTRVKCLSHYTDEKNPCSSTNKYCIDLGEIRIGEKAESSLVYICAGIIVLLALLLLIAVALKIKDYSSAPASKRNSSRKRSGEGGEDEYEEGGEDDDFDEVPTTQWDESSRPPDTVSTRSKSLRGSGPKGN
ncbi:hypothetical protein EGW08_008158 [Elysia chlorotica]|uniref:Uncharacterized protein n=1 Tax=Elysia chlorotica TaxID=188477 RepID=A0A433TRD9_ELYCH|nr:hypothetical protein EGW08_008158 [Elysia chlorotica]